MAALSPERSIRALNSTVPRKMWQGFDSSSNTAHSRETETVSSSYQTKNLVEATWGFSSSAANTSLKHYCHAEMWHDVCAKPAAERGRWTPRWQMSRNQKKQVESCLVIGRLKGVQAVKPSSSIPRRTDLWCLTSVLSRANSWLNPLEAARKCGLQAASVWHDNQTRSLDWQPAAAKEYLKVLRQAPRTLRRCARTSPHPPTFCILQHLPSRSQLITKPLVSGTKYRHGADGNRIPLIEPDTNQLMKMWR